MSCNRRVRRQTDPLFTNLNFESRDESCAKRAGLPASPTIASRESCIQKARLHELQP